ncbi:hypothetical protein N7454_009644 [Penicillium verhagenii]|nr:hypothetical protein N7454_009644 [Penicillium verhagenii]
METRLSERKRRNSTVSSSRSSSPVSHRTRQSVSRCSQDNAASPAPKREVSTPKKSRKRVRFSDPGPRLLDNDICSTGLTPAMRRTSFDTGLSGSGDRTPSRKARRRSAPTPRFRRSFDPLEPFDEIPSERVVQFTPLRQILDTRTKRRIRRIGLSDEINHIQREKREVATFEKTLATLLRERDALQQELTSMKQPREIPEDQLPSYESFWMSSQDQAREVEEQTTLLCDGMSVTSNRSLDGRLSSVENDGDTFMLNDSAIIASNSPVFRNRRNLHSPTPERLSLFDETRNDAAAQTPVNDDPEDPYMRSLNFDLEAARNEKRGLFDACRSQISAFESSELVDALRKPSPPTDFVENIMSTLTAALHRASDATKALEGISQECSSLGFSGTSMDDVLSDIRSHFRSARLELERAAPGETADVALGDGKAILCALVSRVKSLAKELQSERKYHHGSLGREKALRGQFDNLLYRYEAAAEKINSLEDSIESSAGDMLHTRMRMQDLESEDQEKTVGIDRLNTALEKYHEDLKSLEDMVSKMEDENVAIKSKYRAQILALKEQLAHERKQRSAAELSASEYETRIRELEDTFEKNHARASQLTTQIDALEQEHQAAVQEKTHDEQQHAQETGTLNVHISELATSLDATRSEAQRLRRINSGLEQQLKIELEARDDLLDQWAAEQARSFAHMRETVNSERRRAKVRAANWELKSDDLMSDGTTIAGSEPITPVSMTRFVDVEMGRGKDRRRVDSGVGILTGEDILELEDESDIDLPTSNLIDL